MCRRIECVADCAAVQATSVVLLIVHVHVCACLCVQAGCTSGKTQPYKNYIIELFSVGNFHIAQGNNFKKLCLKLFLDS